MTKREEIRKGIEAYTEHPATLWAYLHENGLVIKVDELPCPRCKGSGEVRKWQEQYVGEGYWASIGCPKCKGTGKSGYVATIPLVEG